jgi:hypothetical protein
VRPLRKDTAHAMPCHAMPCCALRAAAALCVAAIGPFVLDCHRRDGRRVPASTGLVECTCAAERALFVCLLVVFVCLLVCFLFARLFVCFVCSSPLALHGRWALAPACSWSPSPTTTPPAAGSGTTCWRRCGRVGALCGGTSDHSQAGREMHGAVSGSTHRAGGHTCGARRRDHSGV